MELLDRGVVYEALRMNRPILKRLLESKDESLRVVRWTNNDINGNKRVSYESVRLTLDLTRDYPKGVGLG